MKHAASATLLSSCTLLSSRIELEPHRVTAIHGIPQSPRLLKHLLAQTLVLRHRQRLAFEVGGGRGQALFAAGTVAVFVRVDHLPRVLRMQENAATLVLAPTGRAQYLSKTP